MNQVFRMISLSIVIATSYFHSITFAGENWPQLRGENQGHVEATFPIPSEWSVEKNIAWKVQVPGHGWSSPVVDGDEIWLTTSIDSQKTLKAICIDAKTGELKQNVQIFRPKKLVEKHQRNSHATPTPVLDNVNVYVHFGVYGTAAVNRKSGDVIWKNQEHKIQHQWGPGGSPVLFDDLLIFNCDGMDSRFVVALNKFTGETVWKKQRTVKISKGGFYKKAFSTPAMWKTGGKNRLLTAGANQFDVLDARNGEGNWNVEFFGYAGVATPVVHDGIAIVTSGYGDNSLMAIQLPHHDNSDARGVLWSTNRNAPIIPTPIIVGQELYMVSDDGIFSCVDLKSGELFWRKRLKGNFASSLTYGDGKIFAPNDQGVTYVISPKTSGLELVSENRLDSNIQATPAFANGAMFIRTQKFLYRIQSNDKRTS